MPNLYKWMLMGALSLPIAIGLTGCETECFPGLPAGDEICEGGGVGRDGDTTEADRAYVNSGDTIYDNTCASSSCHGDDGTQQPNAVDDDVRRIDLTLLPPDLRTLSDLAEYINDEMPYGNPDGCVGTLPGECASETARYLLSEFGVLEQNDADEFDDDRLFFFNSGRNDFETHVAADDEAELAGLSLNDQIQYIIDNVPTGSAEDCVGDCAVHAARFFRSEKTEVIDAFDAAEPSRGVIRDYSNMCQRCHGNPDETVEQGEVTSLRSIFYDHDNNSDDFRDFDDLVDYISREMPQDDPDLCVGDCATDLAHYILSDFVYDRGQPQR